MPNNLREDEMVELIRPMSRTERLRFMIRYAHAMRRIRQVRVNCRGDKVFRMAKKKPTLVSQEDT